MLELVLDIPTTPQLPTWQENGGDCGYALDDTIELDTAQEQLVASSEVLGLEDLCRPSGALHQIQSALGEARHAIDFCIGSLLAMVPP